MVQIKEVDNSFKRVVLTFKNFEDAYLKALENAVALYVEHGDTTRLSVLCHIHYSRRVNRMFMAAIDDLFPNLKWDKKQIVGSNTRDFGGWVHYPEFKFKERPKPPVSDVRAAFAKWVKL